MVKTNIFITLKKSRKTVFRKQFRFGLKIVQLLIKFQKNRELRKNATFNLVRKRFWESFRENHHMNALWEHTKNVKICDNDVLRVQLKKYFVGITQS